MMKLQSRVAIDFLLPRTWNVILTVTFVVVLVAQIETVSAISNAEKAALNEILVGHPDLSSVPSWLQLTDDGNYYGRSWSSDTSNVCSNDGYDFYGIFCRGGSIVGLRITEAFGLPTLTSFPAVSGFVNLRNLSLDVSFTVDIRSFKPLLDSVLQQNLPLTHLQLGRSDFDYLPLPSTLLYLSIGSYQNLSISTMPNLRYLKFGSNSASGLDFLHTSLEELHFSSSASYGEVFPKLNNLPALKVFECACYGNNPVAAEFNSDRIKSLTLYSSDRGVPPIVSGKNLEVLYTYSANVTLGNLPSLKSLTCSAFSSQTQNLPNQLQTLVLRGTNWNVVSFEAVVCPLIHSSLCSLESLTVYPYGTLPENAIPTCIVEPRLKYLEIYKMRLSNAPTSSSFLATLPLSLESLSLAATEPEMSLRDFYRLRNLQSLVVSGDSLSDTELPSDFFQVFQRLHKLAIFSDKMGGRLGKIGGPVLEDAAIYTNASSWDGFVPSPKLHSLSISSNALRSLPSEDEFLRANLQSLKVVGLYFPDSSGPVPSFWANSVSLKSFSINADLYGPLPNSLSTPRLQYLNIRSPRICGSLPNILVPTHIRNLYLQSNSISGSIPASWEDNLTVLEDINLQNTFINGTIPQHLFNHHTLQLKEVRLSDTLLEGSIWNSTRGMPERLYLDNTLVSLTCPPFPSANPSVAVFTNISSCPQDSECVQAWNARRSFTCSEGTKNATLELSRSFNCSVPPSPPYASSPSPTTSSSEPKVASSIFNNQTQDFSASTKCSVPPSPTTSSSEPKVVSSTFFVVECVVLLVFVTFM